MKGLSADRSLATRESLLRRLQDCDDQASWQEFYRTYADLIFRFAIKAGLSETEAEEVVQETVIGVARKLSGFKYDPTVCSFKTWLLNQTGWRVKDQFRRRDKGAQVFGVPRPDENSGAVSEDTQRTSTVERVPDPARNPLEMLWEQDWHQVLIEAAMKRVKEQTNLKDCQIYDLYVLRRWTPREVAKALGVRVAQVYLAKHRVGRLLKRELDRLNKEMR